MNQPDLREDRGGGYYVAIYRVLGEQRCNFFVGSYCDSFKSLREVVASHGEILAEAESVSEDILMRISKYAGKRRKTKLEKLRNRATRYKHINVQKELSDLCA